jgi:hypothetical protein
LASIPLGMRDIHANIVLSFIERVSLPTRELPRRRELTTILWYSLAP